MVSSWFPGRFVAVYLDRSHLFTRQQIVNRLWFAETIH